MTKIDCDLNEDKNCSISKSDEKFYTITHKNDVSFIDHSILDETKNYLQFF